MATEAYAPPMKVGKEGFQGTQDPQHRIRITLSSKSVKNLEKGTRSSPP
jgi:small subunit ribosomal protein S20e